MNPKTEEVIKEHIERIVKDSSFAEMKKRHPNKCPCYTRGKCHDLPEESLNCFLCCCPEYNNSAEEGGCKINSKEGKWYFDERLPKGKIWDCSDCTYPHKEETVKKYLERIFGIKDN